MAAAKDPPCTEDSETQDLDVGSGSESQTGTQIVSITTPNP
jgi:hypothetical protein